MDQFAKSILNYFAAFTETRFNFRKKIDYKWTDDSLTSDLSVFPDFQEKVLSSIGNGNPLDITLTKGEYSISLDEVIFKNELLRELKDNYHCVFLESCIDQVRNKLGQTESSKVIVSGEENDHSKDELLENKEFTKKVFSEGIRKFNLSFRDAVGNILQKIQLEKLQELKDELNFDYTPLSSLNPNRIEQDIFETFQKEAAKCEDVNTYHKAIQEALRNRTFNLEMYDLYATIRKFVSLTASGNLYLFFHEMSRSNGDSTDKYPIFLIEVDIKDKTEELVIKSSRDIVLINTPAINSFGFKNILTTPRAARFTDAKPYLNGVEKFLQNNYDIFNEFLLHRNFKALSAKDLPDIKFRVGLQIVPRENRKLLDYSELITHIDAGYGGKFTDLVGSYVSGKVRNTTDEVDEAYRKRYPPKSIKSLVSTIPLNLNKTQRRIITSIENEKNKFVVVDGPPGTGKSHTIAAITYWANQRNKSIVITSHKQAALDVLDTMMTEKFKHLHPQGKPPILRLSRYAAGINNFQNTLSGPVIAAANKRVNEFNEEAVNKDIESWYKKTASGVESYWASSDNYQNFVADQLRLEQIEKELKQQNINQDPFNIAKINKDEDIDFDAIESNLKKISHLNFNSLSLSQLSYIYQHSSSIPKWTKACEAINSLPVKQSELKGLDQFEQKDLDDFEPVIVKLSQNLKKNSPLFAEGQKLKYKTFSKIKHLGKISPENNEQLKNLLEQVKSLRYGKLISNISAILSKNKEELTVADLQDSIEKLRQIKDYHHNVEQLKPLIKQTGINNIPKLFHLLEGFQSINKELTPKVISSLDTLQKYFSDLLKQFDIDFGNLKSLQSLFSETQPNKKLLEYIRLFVKLSRHESFRTPDQSLISEYYSAKQKELEYINDKRIKNLNNYANELRQILVTMNAGKRLTPNEQKILLENIPCIISEPSLISQYFPMQEDVIDILVIDEASQVSIAESISLMLRAKQVVVFGDEFQYGAVSARNVSKAYSQQYFMEILNGYESDYKTQIEKSEKERLADEVSEDVDDEDLFVQTVLKPEEGKTEWLKTFNIRTSTLDFAKALQNYHTSLDTHFRSFPEIISYSNEFFYKPSQIPLITNRIRTKPISQTLRFLEVEPQGHSGQNVNLDEIEAIKKDITKLTENGFKGTIGIITSFREQKYRTEEVLRKELPDFHRLERDHKLTIWFVGDVQGEERDIIYYSFVQDKKLGNADLRTIYPVINGT